MVKHKGRLWCGWCSFEIKPEEKYITRTIVKRKVFWTRILRRRIDRVYTREKHFHEDCFFFMDFRGRSPRENIFKNPMKKCEENMY